MEHRWLPLTVREGERDREEYEGPFDGVPDWLFGPLWGWVDAQIPVWYRATPTGRAEYEQLAVRLRVSLHEPRRDAPTGPELREAFYGVALANGVVLLDAADYLLARLGADTESERRAAALDTLLRAAGSVYTVLPGDARYLGRRLPDEHLDQLRGLEPRGRPGEHLAAARRSIFGLNPSATAGYRDSVRAVEAAARPVISPRNERATLGTMIRDITDAPANWRVALTHPSPIDQVLTVAGMMNLLWKGQFDRHGTDETVPIDVEQPDAEAAFSIAITLVAWFLDGVVARAEA